MPQRLCKEEDEAGAVQGLGTGRLLRSPVCQKAGF